jgi:hypothetical protein
MSDRPTKTLHILRHIAATLRHSDRYCIETTNIDLVLLLLSIYYHTLISFASRVELSFVPPYCLTLREAVFQLQSARIGPSSKTDALQSLIRSHLSLAKVPSSTGQVLYHL